tara:strand:- start:146 stop:1054 length:909 start_codon:yes stop_codon:yes gene_type:complete
MKKKPKKIAIISSSPLMMMLALKLKKNGNDVTVFDRSLDKGGAWTWFKDYLNKYKIYVPKYTNTIHPYNKKELRFTNTMNKFLKKNFRIKIKKTTKKFSINYKYKDKFIYDFSKFYEYAYKSNDLYFVNDFVSKIETLPNKKVKINSKMLFDKVFLSSFSGVKKIKIEKKKLFNPEHKEIVSEHISIIAKKFKLKNFHYSQFFDDCFDRVKVDKIKNFYTLTARLAYSMKGIKISKLRNFYLERFAEKKDIINVKLSKFRNYYRNKKQLRDLKKAITGSNIKYVETTQFMCGLYSLRKILNV